MDSGESTGTETDRAESPAPWPPALAQDRLCLGAASRNTPLCSHQRSLVPDAGAASCPLWACPLPSRASTANTDLRGEKRAPHRTSSIPLPEKAGSQDLGSGSQPLLSGNSSEHPGDKEMARHPWLLLVHQPLSPSFLCRGTTLGSIFPLKWPERPRCHSARSVSVLESKTGQTALHPNHLHP